MKKMYKKPVSETTVIESFSMMDGNVTLTTSNGGTEQLGPGVIGNAPKRRDEVF